MRTPLRVGVRVWKNGDVPQTRSLGRASGFFRGCSQGLLLVPRTAANELVFSSTQFEKIQSLLRRSAHLFQSNLFPATLSSRLQVERMAVYPRVSGGSDLFTGFETSLSQLANSLIEGFECHGLP